MIYNLWIEWINSNHIGVNIYWSKSCESKDTTWWKCMPKKTCLVKKYISTAEECDFWKLSFKKKKKLLNQIILEYSILFYVISNNLMYLLNYLNLV